MAIKQESDLDFQDTARIRNLPAPANADEPARKGDVDSAIQGLADKDNVLVSTQANLDLSSPGATIDGVSMTADDRVLVRAQTNPEENGIYVWNGASSAMSRALDADTADKLRSACVRVDEGSDEGVTYRQTQVNITLDTDDVIWITFGGSTPNASTTTKGVIEIATQGEVDAGTATDLAVTPETLAAYPNISKGYAADVGNGSDTSIPVTHNLGTKDVIVQLRNNASPYDYRPVEVQATSTSQVTLIFASAPTSAQFRVIIQKAGTA